MQAVQAECPELCVRLFLYLLQATPAQQCSPVSVSNGMVCRECNGGADQRKILETS